MYKQHWFSWLIDLGIVAGATAVAFLAHSNDRPITAVLLHLVGVLLVSAHSGQIRGVLSALLSFVAYLFFLHPANSFSTPSGDTIVPLFAFLLFAIAAGTLVGTLRDRTAAAILANQKVAFLLEISEAMQRVLRVADIEPEVQRLLPGGGILAFKLLVADGDNLIRASHPVSEIPPMDGQANIASHYGSHKKVFFDLDGVTESLGLIELTIAGDELTDSDLRPIAALLALTVDRCILLDRIAEVQAAERTETLKDAILSSVSHDLRTPLTAIDAAASALNSPDLQIADAERRGLLESIGQQCARLNRYTGDLLDMGRIQAGISRAHFELVELGEIFAVAFNQVRSDYPQVSFHRSVPAEPIWVTANGPMLQQALFNLMDNAAKHSREESGVTISIETHGATASVKIEDGGVGIPRTEHSRIFERFHRVEGGNDKGGSGLGLYIARGFVQAFGGDITVESPLRNGHGTRMQVCLPKQEFSLPNDSELPK